MIAALAVLVDLVADLLGGLAVLPAGTPTPTPVPSVPDPDEVSPGLAGFVAIFVLALATVLLIMNMTGRLRRLRYREPPGGDPAAGPEA